MSLISFHKFKHLLFFHGGDREGLEKYSNCSKICKEILGMEGKGGHFTFIYYKTKCK